MSQTDKERVIEHAFKESTVLKPGTVAYNAAVFYAEEVYDIARAVGYGAAKEDAAKIIEGLTLSGRSRGTLAAAIRKLEPKG